MSATPVPCQSSNCIKDRPPSRLECPTCNKLGIKGSFFCCQECFKANWKTHKIIHDIATPRQPLLDDPNINKDGTFNPFGTFKFTGPLRPVYPLSPKREVPAHIPRPDYAEDGIPTSENRKLGLPPRILAPEEIEKMRNVCKLAREVLDIAAAAIRPGITTDQIDAIVHEETIKRDAYPSPLNYRHYPKSVCTSINEVICHGIPDQRKLQEGDIINIDVTLYKDGYHGDLNETYPVGRVDEDSQRLMRTAHKCLHEAIKLCKPGALFRDLGKTIEPIARQNGCSVVRTYCGHGINDLFHTAPNVPHYAKNKAVGTMKAGMTFTIEPMINLGHWDLEHWPDDWTSTTIDGKRSAQFEETLLITDTGVEILTGGRSREDLL
ncbi:methionine aminopeptidase [Dichomitus squalens LYAD-421 SS1]|uniref:Methionine aminopeptidase n=1 Tax=Dichomitus squalens TaxID=114155 RepID=A0A4Q9MXF5_9APHY|nr:methionine aminopeptidase [Dichomitus squalens LYAD-421 SS1]EJF65777.1 methionine aminopeptidase [Dichomitus squalens LYAD-421 SS1]TBU32405.1 methionine aminopeptidase [Dichomitus squalens]